MFYNLGLAGRTLRRMGAVEFATTLAPGLRDVLLSGKVKECVGRTVGDDRGGSRSRGSRQPLYDAVILDAPPTGRVVKFLDVTKAMGTLARTGPIRTQSEGVVALLHSSQTVVHVVTQLEDLPVQETLDTVDELTAAHLPSGCGDGQPCPPRAAAGTRLPVVRAVGGGRAARRPRGRPGSSSRTRRWTVCSAEVGEHTQRLAVEAGVRSPPRRAPGCRSSSCPSSPTGSTWAGSTSSPNCCASRGCGMAADPIGGGVRRTRPPPRAPRPGPAARRPRDPRHRLLRVGRRRQDHDRGRTGAAGRGARPARRRAHDRPGEAARAVDGPRGARQRAAGRPRGRRPCLGRRAAGDDARHAPDLRRDGPRAHHARPRRRRSSTTPSTRPSPRRSPERRSTWPWRSWASSRPPDGGT